MVIKISINLGKNQTNKTSNITLYIGLIVTYSPMVWPKFKLPTCDLKIDTLST